MPVDTKHPHVMAKLPAWTRLRDCVEGSDAIKARSTAYLPRLKAQDDADYLRYLSGALFVNGVGRTVDGYRGLLMRRDPVIKWPANASGIGADIESDVTLSGTPWRVFCTQAVTEVIAPGRMGLLVDMAPNGRAYVSLYTAERILNWRTAPVNGQTTLTRVVLAECVSEPDPKDEFADRMVERIRVVELENGVGPLVHRVFRRVAGNLPNPTASGWYEAERVMPLRRGAPLDFVPFVFVNPSSLDPMPETPPLLDLCDVNLSLYRTCADIEWGRHLTALPTPWVAGFDAKTQLYLGSSKAWVTSNAAAKAGFLEFTGQGLGALERAIEEKLGQMAALGARLLEPQKKAAETAEALRLRYAGESSILASVATQVEAGLETALTWAVWWQQGTSEARPRENTVDVQVNREFFDHAMTTQDMVNLVSVWQQGGISRETLLWSFQRGGMIPGDVSVDDEIQRIDHAGPAGTPPQPPVEPNAPPVKPPLRVVR